MDALSTEEIQLAIHAISSNSITTEEQALGTFTSETTNPVYLEYLARNRTQAT
jgi:hypothetical protein